MAPPSKFSRLIMSESGQLLFAGVGIAVVLALLPLGRIEPWGQYLLPVLVTAVLLTMFGFAFVRFVRSGASWRSCIAAALARPLVTALRAIQLVLLATVLASFWRDFSNGSHNRSAAMMIFCLVNFLEHMARRHYDRRDAGT